MRACVSSDSVTQVSAPKALWKLTELWKNQRTVFPQLLEPSVHTFHNAGCCWIIRHNISSTPGEDGGGIPESAKGCQCRNRRRHVHTVGDERRGEYPPATAAARG